MEQPLTLSATVVAVVLNLLKHQYKSVPGDKGIPSGGMREWVTVGGEIELLIFSPACLIAYTLIRTDEDSSDDSAGNWLVDLKNGSDFSVEEVVKFVFSRYGFSPTQTMRVMLRDRMLVDEPNPIQAHTGAIQFVRALARPKKSRKAKAA